MRTRIINVFASFLFLFMGLESLAVTMSASLVLRERMPISQLAENVTDPNSDRYEEYYTPSEIRDLVAPTDEDYAGLMQRLRVEGFTVLRESPSHLIIQVEGDHKNFERVFKTHIQFTPNKRHRTLKPGMIPRTLGLVVSVSGLDNLRQNKPKYIIHPHAGAYDMQPGILPRAIKKAYDLDSIYQSGLSGKGQDIAVATYMNFSLDDVNQYFEKIELPHAPQVDIVSFNGEAPYDSGSATETELDAEFTGMIAPGANVHVFTSAQNDEDGELALFTAILDDNRAKVVNYSWGMCETDVNGVHRPNIDKVFARAVAQGVNILVASGDTGSDGCGTGTTVADWPAMHPFVVAVGGTSLHLDKTGPNHETGWSGSGGGISTYYKLPKWQSILRDPFVRRSLPDISFNADPETGEAIWVRQGLDTQPGWQQIGGTSMAAPQWAGFLALVNEARHNKGRKAVGFLNPIFYKIQSAQKKEIFTDIVSGNNGAYTAGPGWDAVTGWGTMKGSQMLEFLASH